jgi:hypothetical protein
MLTRSSDRVKVAGSIKNMNKDLRRVSVNTKLDQTLCCPIGNGCLMLEFRSDRCAYTLTLSPDDVMRLKAVLLHYDEMQPKMTGKPLVEVLK